MCPTSVSQILRPTGPAGEARLIMPIYEYKLLGECIFCPQRFERLQAVGEPPLTECEFCGIPCQRLISLPAHQKSASKDAAKMSANKLESHGFARWEKTSPGNYERTAGTDADGPRFMRKDGTSSD